MILALHVSGFVLHFNVMLLQVNLHAPDVLEDRNQQLQLL